MERSIDRVSNILVLGAGAMGAQIGLVCSLAGYQVTVQDIDEQMLDKAQVQLRERTSRNVEKGRMEQGDVEEVFGRMVFTTDLESAAADYYVIEVAVEKLDAKRNIFASLDTAQLGGYRIESYRIAAAS